MADYQLEIHHVDVYGGDATVIIVRNTSIFDAPIVYSMLIDAGAEKNGKSSLATYIKDNFKGQKFDLFIASHYHEDHIAGVDNLDDKGDWTIKSKKILDIGTTASSYYPTDRIITDKKYESVLPSYIKVYYDFSDEFEERQRFVPAFLDPANYIDGVFNKGIVSEPIKDGDQDTGFVVTFWGGKGMTADGKDIIKDQMTDTQVKINANDLSISFTIHNEQTKFSYFSGGDLSGDSSLTEYFNVEGPTLALVSKKFTEGVKVVKATHHGSDRNNHEKFNVPSRNAKYNIAPGFFETLRPETIIVPCNQTKQVPGLDYLKNRLYPYLKGDLTRRAYFLNKVIYPHETWDNTIYQVLEKLRTDSKTAVSTNIKKSAQDEYGNIVIDDIGAVIVVAPSVLGGAVTTKPPYFQNSQEQRKEPSYQVYFNTNIPPGRKYSSRKITRLRDGIAPNLLNKNLEGPVKIGFMDQAQEICQQLNVPNMAPRLGVVKKDFPALIGCLKRNPDDLAPDPEYVRELLKDTQQLQAALLEKMIEVLTSCYTWSDFFGEWRRNSASELKRENEITLYNLTVRNINQVVFFSKVYYSSQPVKEVLLNLNYQRWTPVISATQVKGHYEIAKKALGKKRKIGDVDQQLESIMNKRKWQ